ncbi:MAG: class I SAM-dependent methyltransferase [Candidatus Lernaella stagnicola]|nr:class I SAM-dependent methyltransferase [Candidatus Lernaella stagnicola]
MRYRFLLQPSSVGSFVAALERLTRRHHQRKVKSLLVFDKGSSDLTPPNVSAHIYRKLLILCVFLSISCSECVESKAPPQVIAREKPPPAAAVRYDIYPRSLVTPPPSDEQFSRLVQAIDHMLTAGERVSGQHTILYAVAKHLNLKSTDVFADIGAGTGALEIILMENDLPFREALAVDIDGRALKVLDHVLSKQHFTQSKKVKTIHSTTSDVRLPAKSVDVAAFISAQFFRADVLDSGELSVPPNIAADLRSLHAAMKPGGIVHVYVLGVNLKEDERRFVMPLEQTGFRLVKKADELADFPQTCKYFLFEKK